MESKIDKILDKYRTEGRLEVLSQEESAKINRRINEEMKKVRRDYRMREAKSYISAGEVYFNC
jgi:hypothetical protein